MKVLMDYWWIGGIALLLILLLWMRHLAKTKAKLVALQWIAVAEKMVFSGGDAQITFVAQKAYSLLPPKVKLFIPYAAFNVLVRELYSEVKIIIEDMRKKLQK